MKKQKLNEKVECVECKKQKDKADCHLYDKVLRTFLCHKCFMNDNNVLEEDVTSYDKQVNI